MADEHTIEGMELFQTGCWNYSDDPDDCYDKSDLYEMVRASKEISYTPVLKLGHSDEQRLIKGEEYPALGKIVNLRVVGEKLIGDVKNIPKRVFNILRSGMYPRVSAEIVMNMTDEATKKFYKRMFRALAVLSSMPAVTTLRDIESYLYQKNECDNCGGEAMKTREYVISDTERPNDGIGANAILRRFAAEGRNIYDLKLRYARYGLDEEADAILTTACTELQKKNPGKSYKEICDAVFEASPEGDARVYAIAERTANREAGSDPAFKIEADEPGTASSILHGLAVNEWVRGGRTMRDVLVGLSQVSTNQTYVKSVASDHIDNKVMLRIGKIEHVGGLTGGASASARYRQAMSEVFSEYAGLSESYSFGNLSSASDKTLTLLFGSLAGEFDNTYSG